MSENKNIKDFKEGLIEKTMDKTLRELMEDTGRYDFRFGHSYGVNVRMLRDEIRKALYNLISGSEGFYDLPILGVTHSPEYDWPAYAIKKNHSSYILICHDYDRVESFVILADDCVLEPSPFATVRDLDDDLGYHLIGDDIYDYM